MILGFARELRQLTNAHTEHHRNPKNGLVSIFNSLMQLARAFRRGRQASCNLQEHFRNITNWDYVVAFLYRTHISYSFGAIGDKL